MADLPELPALPTPAVPPSKLLADSPVTIKSGLAGPLFTATQMHYYAQAYAAAAVAAEREACADIADRHDYGPIPRGIGKLIRERK
jgi:hypothetical protein